MSGTYIGVLPEVFPYYIDASPEEVKHIVGILMQERPGVPNGSSCAVTSEPRRGMRRLWLSRVSFRTLIDMNIVPHMFDAKTTETGE